MVPKSSLSKEHDDDGTVSKGKKPKTKADKKRERAWNTEWYKPNRQHPYALAGATSFVEGTTRPKQVKGSLGLLKKKKRQWLENESTYQLHRPARKTYPRRPFGPVYAIDDTWQMDLSDMQRDEVKRENNGMSWILFAIDVLSRKAWAVPLKNKSGPETARGIQEIFESVSNDDTDHTIPRVIYVDRGTEFYNKDVKRLLASYPIPPQLHSGDSTTKAAIVERLQRTIKGRLWKYFYEHGSYRWIDILPHLMESYNESKHRTIQEAPNRVSKTNEEKVYERVYGPIRTYRDAYETSAHQEGYYKFQVDDVVRISKSAQLFDKKYLPQWSEELFRVRARDPGPPPYYRLKEYRGDEFVTGTFYEQEMQLVKNDQDIKYRIESILKRRTDPKTKKKQVLVKYKGWPESYNEWIDASAVTNLS